MGIRLSFLSQHRWQNIVRNSSSLKDGFAIARCIYPPETRIYYQAELGNTPTEVKLNARLSTIYSGGDLLSQEVAPQVSSARTASTTVFGMGTGGTSSARPPESGKSACGIPLATIGSESRPPRPIQRCRQTSHPLVATNNSCRTTVRCQGCTFRVSPSLLYSAGGDHCSISAGIGRLKASLRSVMLAETEPRP